MLFLERKHTSTLAKTYINYILLIEGHNIHAISWNLHVHVSTLYLDPFLVIMCLVFNLSTRLHNVDSLYYGLKYIARTSFVHKTVRIEYYFF
jgi:hypothetical protein